MSSSATECAPIPPGLVAWWPAEGNANDVVGSYDFDDNAGPYVDGKVGRTFSFDGVNERVYLGETIPTGSDNWGVEGWIYWHGLTGDPGVINQTIFHNGTGGPNPAANGYVFVVNEGEESSAFGTVQIYYREFYAFSPGIVLAVNQWQHFAVTRENGVLKMYINGVLEFSNATPVSPIAPVAGFILIGGGYPFSFNGLVDEWSVYDQALSQASIAALYNAGNIGKCPTNELMIQRLNGEVELLIQTGVLNPGNGNALLSKLDQTIKKLEQGKVNDAIHSLDIFINQVHNFIQAGKLSPSEGDELINAANEMINQLSG